MGDVFKSTLKNWADDFSQKTGVAVENWLEEKMQDTYGNETGNVCREIMGTIEQYEQNRNDARNAYEQGKSKEEWMSGRLYEATVDLGRAEQRKVISAIQKELASNFGIEIEQDEVVAEQSEYAFQDKLMLKSVGEFVSARAMEVLGEGQEELDDTEDSEYVEKALQDHAESELKKIASGTLATLVKKGRIPLLPPSTPVGCIVHIACLGIDNGKTLLRVAKQEISLTEGLQIISRDTVAAMFGIFCDSTGKITMSGLLERLLIIGKPLQCVNKVTNAMLGLVGNKKITEAVNAVRQKVIPVARNFAQSFFNTAVNTVKSFASKVKNFLFG